MFKKIFCLVMFLFLSLLLIQNVRDFVADRILFPIVNTQAEKSNNPELMLYAARLKFYITDYDRTKEIIAKILKTPNIKNNKKVYEKSYLILGHTFYEEHDYANAFKAYYLLLKSEPRNKDALRKSVRILMAGNKAEAAIPLINYYLSKKPNDPFALVERCAVYTRLGKLIDAGRDCETAVKARRGYARGLYDYAVALDRIGFKKEAADYFKQATLRSKHIKPREEIEADMLNAGKESQD